MLGKPFPSPIAPQLSIARTALQVHALHPGSSGLCAGVIALLKSKNLFLDFIFYLERKKKKKSPQCVCYHLGCRAGSTQACCWPLQRHRRVSVMLKAQVAQSMEIMINKKGLVVVPSDLVPLLPRLRPRSFPILLFLSFF